ncbi:RNA-binding transcriptional accessory protein [Erysipelothrix sp. HDW6C]|uniref:Tex family protein n=1 Tax=Erysipelothrix sp. HDW6C TaxID=2714930 RepID=UPI0014080C97|nr:Tex family protein [Erysipelothrix sp. HDW6C]QIK69724.1 RNA-binding transcriptional accessory protein [Erysipelothrix sp. HDW6C]
MENNVLILLKKELAHYKGQQIDAVLDLLADGNTVPFIARYRKEVTGTLDEVQIREIADRHDYLDNIEKRKEEVIRLIDEQGKLTPELEAEIVAASVLQKVEDIYRPYKQKRRTKATIAREKGLEPLALRIMALPLDFNDSEADAFINAEFELETREDVFLGAHEIIAEIIGDDADFRTWIRDFTMYSGVLKTDVKDKEKDERGVYEMYYDFSQPTNKIASHRVLAVNRAEKEDVIKVDIVVDEEKINQNFERKLVRNATDSPAVGYLRTGYMDSYKRFIKPAIEREIRNQLTEDAEKQAIHIFGENLRNLLLQAPLKGRVVMGFDPAYRTGCKLAIVDETGKVLAINVIYPHKPAPQHKQAEAEKAFIDLIEKYKVDMVAIGNGTASRESEVFVAENLKKVNRDVFYLIVNEAGASVYSASDVARKEFPNLQVEERSAVSIARRIQDPLAELVKIDPQSVGVGQYQHDVTQKTLSEALDVVVETAVNQVGVDVNTASPQLLEHIAGLTKTTAQNIVTFREENGMFASRTEIKSVPRLGPKSFEQAIGFLRIPKGKNILDNTGIHPETYTVTKQILKDTGIKLEELGTDTAREKLEGQSLNDLSTHYDIGKETLKDIFASLIQPGRDMRDEMSSPLLRSDVLTMEDLKPGMELNGTVRNVVDFGAFVDIGVKQDGLVHISKLSKNFVKHPTDVVAVGDVVKVWVMEVDLKKQRIQLSMLPLN